MEMEAKLSTGPSRFGEIHTKITLRDLLYEKRNKLQRLQGQNTRRRLDRINLQIAKITEELAPINT